jgi:TRAP-type C4-dicarboxylate transport system substrate-binding protein
MRSWVERCSFGIVGTRRCAALSLVVPLLLSGCRDTSDKAGGKPAQPPMTLTMAVPFGQPTAVNGFVAEVARLSHGAMRIAVTARWRYGEVKYENGLIHDVRVRKVDLGVAGTRAWDSVGVRSFRALGAPLLIDSYSLQDRVLATAVVAHMLPALRRLGLVGLGVLPGELRRPLGVAHPLRGRRDYVGRRIGVQQSLVASAAMRALGARPIWFGGGAAIARFAGIEYGVSGIAGSKYDSTARYLTGNVVLWPRPIVLFANGAVFARLTAAQRRVLTRAVANNRRTETTAVMGSERSDTSLLCSRRKLRFVTASPAELASLRAAVRPVYAQLERDPASRRVIARIEAIRRRLRAPVSAVPACAGPRTTNSPAAASPLDGTYRLTLARAALPTAAQLPEEYGSWQIVIDRGRFRFRQHSNAADWVADGTLRVRRGTVQWTLADVLDVGPHGTPDSAPVKPGDTIRFRWRQGGRQLILSQLAGPQVAALSARPLTRVGAAPGGQPLQNPAALDGTWAMTPTAADVIAHHDDVTGISGNTGPLRIVVRGSRCRWTQHAPERMHWGIGACRFAGDTVEFAMKRTDDSGDPAPFYLRWSVFHDRLTFRQAPGFSPEAWAYHPWHRIS